MKFSEIFIERTLENHPHVKKILHKVQQKFLFIDRYHEIFNRKQTSFRLQKNFPGLILAEKLGKWLHQIPPSYGIGRKYNFYFSHILNCPFDCQYCFLQAMYTSAHFVHFVNYESCFEEMQKIMKEIPPQEITFFSGYDGDSLALEPYTEFLTTFFPFFQKSQSELEIRTKSTAILPLLQHEPTDNIIIAYSLNPELLSKEFETKTPPFSQRIKALQKLQQHSYQVGLRFDPVLYVSDYQKHYEEMFQVIEKSLDLTRVHSVTLGPLRIPRGLKKNIEPLIAKNRLFAFSQKSDVIDFCKRWLTNTFAPNKIFLCNEPS